MLGYTLIMTADDMIQFNTFREAKPIYPDNFINCGCGEEVVITPFNKIGVNTQHLHGTGQNDT